MRLGDDDCLNWDPGELLAKVRGYLDDAALEPQVTAFTWSRFGEMSDAGTPVQCYLRPWRN